jgi:tRNA U54 and U55 pseudouridine synthase Pus10
MNHPEVGCLLAVQEGEAEKQKAYVAKCRLPCRVTADMLERLSAMKDVVLQQRTPTRVEQRRAMLVRQDRTAAS